MADNLQIMQAIWDTASPTFQQRIPQPSRDNLASIGIMIGDDSYAAQRNEIYDSLINVIGKQKVWQRSLSNPLSQFKAGTMPLGDTYEEIMTDIIDGETFRIGEDDQFTKWPDKVRAAYHRINREQFYPVTIERTKINRAFQSEGGLQSLINALTNQMYSSNDLDEFLYTKQLFNMYLNNTNQPLLTTQKLHVPDPRINVMDSSMVQGFVMACKGVARQMAFPKKVYNPFGFTLQSNPSDLIFITLADIAIISEVNTLSQAFSPQYLDVKIPIIAIDDFGPGMENVLGIICERQTFQIIDTLRTSTMSENARNLYYNYFYHVHQMYVGSPMRQCVYLIGDPAVQQTDPWVITDVDGGIFNTSTVITNDVATHITNEDTDPVPVRDIP